jgi:predicted RecB family nuclease
MLKRNGSLLFSASDLVNFLGCRHATFMDLRQLVAPIEVPEGDEQNELLQEKGLEHERAYLAKLKAEGRAVVELDAEMRLEDRVRLTREAMAAGADVIYQGALFAPPWHGYSDFLVRVDGPSSLGCWSYEVADTKLSRSAKPKHVIQLSVYSGLVSQVQGVLPRSMHIALGDGTTVSLSVCDFVHYQEVARERFEDFCARPPETSSGEPCAHCAYCKWAPACEAEWEQADHLSQVANITKVQTKKLSDAGISTKAALAATPRGTKVPALNGETFERLRSQAALQVGKRTDGVNRHEVLARVLGKGFDRLPRPTPGDLFFDMEGDPLYAADGNLEYLFGFAHEEAGRDVRFTAFWAHDRAEEKLAFERAVDFIAERLQRFPDAHVFHYATYEETALKRLAMYHGTREIEIDNLLRQRKLVDLYKVVREGLRVSEPSYSIKNLETFYMPDAREGVVTSGGDSIVIYERWRKLQDSTLLDDIERYNETDCRSTKMSRDWLLTLRPAEANWFTGPDSEPEDPKQKEREAKRLEAEARTTATVAALTKGAPQEERSWRELLAHLLEFHRREAKPAWWGVFSRLEAPEEELMDDAECIGGLTRDTTRPNEKEKRSTIHHYRFPAQDFKMRIDDDPIRTDTGKVAGKIVALDEEACTISLKIGPTKELPDELSLIPAGPLDDGVLREAVYRFAKSVHAGEPRYAGLRAILRKSLPRLTGLPEGQPIIPADAEPVAAAVDAIGRLDESYMLVQGPPGTGKTFSSSHAIVELLRRGYRVGVSSLSHKAINNLLECVEQVAEEKGVTFTGIKKSSNEDHYLNGAVIEDTEDNDYACSGEHQLIAGTAWLFAREDLDQQLDYLFIDEAGQVSLANVVAMGVSARNIVLVGDQMQLSQPLQGAHPGESGLSALEYLLGDHATVPPERGIFLAETRRMNPEVCGFISEAVYEGRLHPVAGNEKQRLVLDRSADAALASCGLKFVPVEHDGCSQKSEEEAERLVQIYRSLMRQRWVDREGATHVIGPDDVLVVSPFNMQVNLLRLMLPDGARVGTVDKFQGQEAPIVLISMATSSGDDIPRNIEFLFSRNRLNVAISRARCLAVIIASRRLLEVTCRRIEQMRLVNTLCFGKRYADDSIARVDNEHRSMAVSVIS